MRGYKTKITVITVLSLLILLGLGYLKFFGTKGTKPAKTPDAAAVTATPSDTPEETGDTSAETSAETADAQDTAEPAQTPEATAKPVITSNADIDSDDSINRLLNKKYTISESYWPGDLRTVNVHCDVPQSMRTEAADALEKMFNGALNDGITLKLISGYRSYKLQTSLYNTYLYRYGREKTEKMDAIPGASEHQLGLAADIGNWSGNCELNTCFTSYPTYTWLQDHAHEYGFIERYPQGKENITGVMFSPWHWRYVGVEEAENIHASGLTMEEYYGRTQ